MWLLPDEQLKIWKRKQTCIISWNGEAYQEWHWISQSPKHLQDKVQFLNHFTILTYKSTIETTKSYCNYKNWNKWVKSKVGSKFTLTKEYNLHVSRIVWPVVWVNFALTLISRRVNKYTRQSTIFLSQGDVTLDVVVRK